MVWECIFKGLTTFFTATRFGITCLIGMAIGQHFIILVIRKTSMSMFLGNCSFNSLSKCCSYILKKKLRSVSNKTSNRNLENSKIFQATWRVSNRWSTTRRYFPLGPLRQATGPPWSGAGVGVGMLRGAGDSLTWKYKSYKISISCFW